MSVNRFVGDDGYARYAVDGTLVHEHQLCALAIDGIEPIDVFGEGCEVHHSLGSTSLGVQIDLPANVDVLESSDHREMHARQKADVYPSIIGILAEERDRGADRDIRRQTLQNGT